MPTLVATGPAILRAVPAVTGGSPAAPVPRTSGAHGLDKTLFLDVNHFAQHTGWLHGPMDAYANYGVALFGLLLVIGWWLARQRRSARVTFDVSERYSQTSLPARSNSTARFCV